MTLYVARKVCPYYRAMRGFEAPNSRTPSQPQAGKTRPFPLQEEKLVRQIYVRQEERKKVETRSECLGREETQEASQEKSCSSK